MGVENSGIPFRFKRNARIGEAAAELDDEFLFQSFVDVGDYDELRNTKSARRIVIGRTGSGKTALLRFLMHQEEHVVEIDPEHLSLNFIANNTIIRFFEELGVKLDLFYSLLWKHVLAVELIKSKYQLTTEEKTRSWIHSVLDNLKKRDAAKERALSYLRDWGDKFWIETESRVKELTTKLAGELKAEMGIDGIVGDIGVSAAASLSEEQKREIVYRGQKIVNGVQIRELADVVRFLDEEVFTDDQKPYFITIDKLDENWVDDELRYKLIRALIESIRAFQKIGNVKVIVALRHDLLQKVFAETADAGFQAEKFEALMLRLRWSAKQIENLLDTRVGVLVRQQYTSRPVRMRELFPEKIGRTMFIDYFLQRTALRPRDAILFVNDCISRAEAAGQVKVQNVYDAETEYSQHRKDSLIYEWKRLYPSLDRTIQVLERLPVEFRISSLDKAAVDALIEDLAALQEESDPCVRAAIGYLNSPSGSKHGVVAEIFKVFYEVGLVGLRFEGGSGSTWAQNGVIVSVGQIKPNTKAQVHPMFYQALHTHFQT